MVRGPQAGGVLAFSHDGESLATWGAGRIALWDAADGRDRAVWEGPDRGVHVGAFAPDGATFLFVARGDYPQPTTVRRVDVATGRPLEPVVMESEVLARPAALYGLAFTPDGDRLRAAFGDRTGVRKVVEWDPATGRALGRRAVSCPVPPGLQVVSRDGRFMAAAAYGAEDVTVWDLDEDRAHAVLAPAGPSGARNPLRAVCGLAFSPDGATLVVSRDDGSSEFWGLKSARVLKTLRLHPPGYAPTAVRFTPDGATLASLGLFKQPVALFDVVRIGVSDLWSRQVAPGAYGIGRVRPRRQPPPRPPGVGRRAPVLRRRAHPRRR